MAISQDLLQKSTNIPPRIWKSDRLLAVPLEDIVTFAFANCENYDEKKPIFVDGNDPSTYITASMARQKVQELITGLRKYGLQEGDTVCLHAYNNIWYPLIWLAIIGAGGCFTGTNPAYTSSELSHHFRITSTKFIIAQADCCKAIEEAASICQIPTSNIFSFGPVEYDPIDGCRNWSSLLGDRKPEEDVHRHTKKDLKSKVAVYGTTSGTTGLPKAAALSHGSVVAHAAIIESHLQRKQCQPVQLVYLPVFHAFAAQLALILPLRQGITTYFMPKFRIDDFIRIVEGFSITDTSVVPPIVTTLLKLPRTQSDCLRSLRYVICAGAPLVASIQNELYSILSPDAVVAQCWGTTECGWMTSFSPDEKDSSGSVGRLLPNVELKIVDEEGNIVSGDSECGEAYIRSPVTMMSYWNNPESTAAAFDNEGFYKTGDRVYIQDNKIFVDGRIKDIMKVNGWQVSPAEIESVLLLHPMIVDVAVVGVSRISTTGIKDTLPRAYVVRAENCNTENLKHLTKKSMSAVSISLYHQEQLSVDDVKAFVAARLISYKRLTGGVIFTNKIPRSATGKILRRLLVDSTPESQLLTPFSRTA